MHIASIWDWCCCCCSCFQISLLSYCHRYVFCMTAFCRRFSFLFYTNGFVLFSIHNSVYCYFALCTFLYFSFAIEHAVRSSLLPCIFFTFSRHSLHFRIFGCNLRFSFWVFLRFVRLYALSRFLFDVCRFSTVLYRVICTHHSPCMCT